MKKGIDSYLSTEQYEFKPFSEDDLAMVLGGGGDEQTVDFWQGGTPLDQDEDDLPE